MRFRLHSCGSKRVTNLGLLYHITRHSRLITIRQSIKSKETGLIWATAAFHNASSSSVCFDSIRFDSTPSTNVLYGVAAYSFKSKEPITPLFALFTYSLGKRILVYAIVMNWQFSCVLRFGLLYNMCNNTSKRNISVSVLWPVSCSMQYFYLLFLVLQLTQRNEWVLAWGNSFEAHQSKHRLAGGERKLRCDLVIACDCLRLRSWKRRKSFSAFSQRPVKYLILTSILQDNIQRQSDR